LQILETAEVGRSAAHAGFYFPIQLVARPGDSGVQGARGYAGRIESGSVKQGDTVTELPSGLRSRIQEIRTWNERLPMAVAPQSVTVVLEDQIDISRGDVLVAEGSAASAAREFDATLCWLSEEAFNRSRRYLVKHGARTVKAIINAPQYRVNVNTLAREQADTLALNDIGRVSIKTSQPLAYEPYGENRAAGSFIVIDEASNNTVAAGLIA
jgi:sulfate adenylyltransferase subunit 1